MKEQTYLPTGEGSSNEEKKEESAPKALSRPLIAGGLLKPKTPERPIIGWKCSCGNYYTRYGGCKSVPI